MRKYNLIISSILIGIFILVINSSLKAQTTDTKLAASNFDMGQAKKIIERIDKQFSEDFKNGDSLALAAYYTKDGKLGSVKGKDIISAWGKMIRNSIKDGAPNMIFTINSLSSDGEYLVELGIYEFKDENDNVNGKGKYLVVWKQEDGKWKIYRDIGL